MKAWRNRLNRWVRGLARNPFGMDGQARWWIAKLLNKRRDVCWATCVTWAMFGDFRDVLDFFPTSRWYTGVQMCRKDTRRVGVCYCGKMTTVEFADEYKVTPQVLVTNEVDPEDEPDLTTFEFK